MVTTVWDSKNKHRNFLIRPLLMTINYFRQRHTHTSGSSLLIASCSIWMFFSWKLLFTSYETINSSLFSFYINMNLLSWTEGNVSITYLKHICKPASVYLALHTRLTGGVHSADLYSTDSPDYPNGNTITCTNYTIIKVTRLFFFMAWDERDF